MLGIRNNPTSAVDQGLRYEVDPLGAALPTPLNSLDDSNLPYKDVSSMKSIVSKGQKSDSVETRSYVWCRLKSVTIRSCHSASAEKSKSLTFHTHGGGGQHARLRTESPSRCPLPISNNFQHQQTITTCLAAKQICFTKPEIRKQKGRKLVVK